MRKSSQTIKKESRRYVTKRWLKRFEEKGKGWLMITTTSMNPIIQPGNLVCIEKVFPSDIHIGDIIAFWKENMLVTHRVIRIIKKEENIYFIERADRRPQHTMVDSQSLMGKLREIKKGKKICHMSTFPWTLFNRIIGITFLCSHFTRTILKKIPLLPDSLKIIIRKFFRSMRLKREKLLEYLFKKTHE
jgi:signal peptidase I